jgi:hypothetical protein
VPRGPRKNFLPAADSMSQPIRCTSTGNWPTDWPTDWQASSRYGTPADLGFQPQVRDDGFGHDRRRQGRAGAVQVRHPGYAWSVTPGTFDVKGHKGTVTDPKHHRQL